MSQLHCCALMSIENDILREIDFTGIITEFASGSSIKYVTLFLANFDPLPLSHFVTHPGTPQKYVTHLGPPRFLVGLVQKPWTKATCTNSLSIVCGVFFVRGSFVWKVLFGVVFAHSPFCHNTSVTLHIFLCARVLRPVCVHTRSQLRP